MTRDVWFLDNDGITAMYQRGVWLFQKFHTLAQVRELGAKYIGPKFEVIDHDGPIKQEVRASSFAVWGQKVAELTRDQVLSALSFEFDLPLPNGKSYSRHEDICQAWKAAIELNS